MNNLSDIGPALQSARRMMLDQFKMIEAAEGQDALRAAVGISIETIAEGKVAAYAASEREALLVCLAIDVVNDPNFKAARGNLFAAMRSQVGKAFIFGGLTLEVMKNNGVQGAA
jgi:hypothetical protein